MREVARTPDRAPYLLRARLPRWEELGPPVPLGHFPTPVTEAPELAPALGLQSLWIKRDDLSSPIYGGTKVRSLEFLFGAARAAGAREVVTLGATGSHHVLATALFAVQEGLRVRAVLFPQPPTEEIGLNSRVLPRIGVQVRAVNSVVGVPWAWWREKSRQPRPFVIPAGGSSPLGILGSVEGYLELDQAIRSGSAPRPDCIVVPAGSCGTAAGLLLGRALVGENIPIVAVRVVPRVVSNAGRAMRLAREGARLLRSAGAEFGGRLGPLEWIHDAAGPGYARPTDGARRMVETVRRLANFRCETTYTGKTLAALERPRFAGRNVLFWNTFSAVDPGPVERGNEGGLHG